jgi:hypothetical protein
MVLFFEIKRSSLWLDNRSPDKSFLLGKILSCRHIISYTLIKQNPTSQFLLFHSPPRHRSLLAHASTISLSIRFHRLAKSLPFIIDPVSTMHLCGCSYGTTFMDPTTLPLCTYVDVVMVLRSLIPLPFHYALMCM